MSVLQERYELMNKVEIPKLGFGTWQIPDSNVADAVELALQSGYRHIDTAAAYGNEAGVGVAVRESGIERSDVFITTKIPAECKTYDEAKATIGESLGRLNLGYIDLLLIHAPKPWAEMFTDSDKTYFDENAAVWKAMEEAYEAGSVKAIGVSNFTVADIQNIQERGKVGPMVNQIKYHIGWTQDDITSFCQEHGILVEGYSPIATGALIHNEEIATVAQKYDKSVPQLCIRYVFQKGLLPLPKSTHEEYIVQNAEIDFEITADDMKLLDSVQTN